MRFTINKVINICKGEKGIKLQMIYNETKSRTFVISKGLTETQKLSIKDSDNNLLLENESLQIHNDKNFKKANETKNILIQSIHFIREKIKKMILSNEYDYIIENEYGNITLLNEILNNINSKLVSFNSQNKALIPIS